MYFKKAFNIFKRINTGGIVLSPQEIRHALNQGPVTDLISRMIQEEMFKKATANRLAGKRMADREYVTRFIAFTELDYRLQYQGNIDSFLTKALKRVNAYHDEKEYTRIYDNFVRIMDYCYRIFGKYAFRRVNSEYRRGPINNAAFYDILKEKLSIATDSSTTVMEAVKLLKGKEKTILSVSTEIFSELWNTDIKIISTGGNFNRNTLSLQGRVAKETIGCYHVDIALLSCKGLDMEYGAMDTNENESEVKKCMISQAEEVALLVDHTKFDKTAFAHLLDLKDVDYLVTDEKPDDAWIHFCKENHINLIYPA